MAKVWIVLGAASLCGMMAVAGCRRARPGGHEPGRARVETPLPGRGGLADHRRASHAVEPPAGAVALADAPPQVTRLTLPFRGIWGVIQGTDSDETHVGYAAFALDFVPAERLAGAKPAHERRLDEFPCFGQPVLAPADGKVVWVHDGEPDLPPYNKAPRSPGNFLIVEHTPDELSELRHLKSGSILVHEGERVRRGQPLARCGNSGNAKTPHLHFGFLGSLDPIATRPLRFSDYEVLERDGTPHGRWRPGDGVPREGQLLRQIPSR